MNENMTVRELALEALNEAQVLESAKESFDLHRMLYIAECLSGVPYFLVKQVYDSEYVF